MPADITGTTVFNLQRNEFSLVKGPLFTTFLLADEINRAPAKTQSALLEAMQERTVTIDRESYRLSPDFTVFATQNPIESEGTYPLPEAQKDRFMRQKIPMTWPQSDEEIRTAGRSLTDRAPEAVLQRGEVTPCLSGDDLRGLREALAFGCGGERGADRVRGTGSAPHADGRRHSGGCRAARQPVDCCGRRAHSRPWPGGILSARTISALSRSRFWNIACSSGPNRNWKACAPLKFSNASCMRCLYPDDRFQLR